VPVITLDAYLRERAIERVDVVKIDVEGAEPLVLQGMGELLRRCVPRLVILESWPETLSFDSITPGAAMYAGGPARFAAAAALLEECGFRPRAIGNDGAVNETFSPGALANVAFIR
jgi:hypothetical protein